MRSATRRHCADNAPDDDPVTVHPPDDRSEPEPESGPRAGSESPGRHRPVRDALTTNRFRARLARARAAAKEAIDEDFAPDLDAEPIPRAVKLTAGWTIRLIVIAAGILGLMWLLSELTVVVVPVVISLLLAALLAPLVRLLRYAGLPGVLPAVLAFLAGILFIGGLIALIVQEFVGNYETVYSTVRSGINELIAWLADGPLHMDTSSLGQTVNKALANLQANPDEVVNGTLNVVSTTGSALSGLLLTLFTTYFFLADGNTMWRWVAKLFPRGARWKVNRAGHRAWDVLVSYMSVTLLVALIVGTATWIACKIASVPLALSAGLIAFVFAFIPTLGGLISSIVVILLTLVSTNLTTAIVMALVMIGIQTVQGNFIYPMLMNRQLKVHPLASLLLVVLGAVLGGIFGALIAVPLAALVNTAWLDLLRASQGLPQSDAAVELGLDSNPEDDDSLVDPTLNVTD